MNVDRMRRNLARSRAEFEQQRHAAWLATLTPEHRQKHVAPMSWGICGECIVARQAEAAAQLGRAISELPKEWQSPRVISRWQP